MRCILLFFSLFLNDFFEDLCFLDALLRVLRNPDGNGRAEPLHYIAELHPSCYLYECCFSQLIILTIIFHHFSVQPIAYFYRVVDSWCIGESGRGKGFSDFTFGEDLL